MAKIAETQTAEHTAVILANSRHGNRKAPAARYRGRRLPGIVRLMTRASGPRFANHRSALVIDSGLKYFRNHGDGAGRRRKLVPNAYKPTSPNQIPTKAAARPRAGSRRPVAESVAASKVAPSS